MKKKVFTIIWEGLGGWGGMLEGVVFKIWFGLVGGCEIVIKVFCVCEGGGVYITTSAPRIYFIHKVYI